MRKEIKEVTLRTAIGSLTFDVYWRPMGEFYRLDDVYIDFNFNIEISHFMLDSHYAVPNLKVADDVAGAILNVMYEGFKNPKYAPCPLLVNMVCAGKLGIKSGEGFYDYSESRKAEKIAKQFLK